MAGTSRKTVSYEEHTLQRIRTSTETQPMSNIDDQTLPAQDRTQQMRLMPHSRSQTNLQGDEYPRHYRSRSQSRSRMVIESTEVTSGRKRDKGFMQVEISMAMETMVNEVQRTPPYQSPATISRTVPSKSQRYVYSDEEWTQCTKKARTRMNESAESLEVQERRGRSKSTSLREFLDDYDNIFSSGKRRSRSSERNLGVYSEERNNRGAFSSSSFGTVRTAVAGSSDPSFRSFDTDAYRIFPWRSTFMIFLPKASFI
ncbi:hypothetical protein AB6A40_001054 [Gnathostoma spinigerum]|uniref:Uncharacterized protein n=1 Tax=Gnathostoma spinigerum TaxID=75299 RepID=A0ABD6E3C3_9BILA